MAYVIGQWMYVRRVRRGKRVIPDAEFAEMFGEGDAGVVALHVRRILERTMGSAANRVGPDDVLFSVAVLGDDADLRFTTFIMDVEREFGVSIPDGKPGELRTLRRVMLFCLVV